MGILNSWYKGFLHPFEEIVPRDADYRSLGEKIGSEREYLKSKLSPEDRERFEKWGGLLLESACMEEYANFSYGFKLGAGLMCEVFCGEDGLNLQN